MDLTRRTFLKLMAQVVLTAGLSSHFPRLAEAADTGTMPIQYLRQIITHDSRTSRTIMWQSTASLPDCQVEYRPEAQRHSIAQAASLTSLTEDSTTNYFYSVTLTGLQPGTIYSYRIVDAKGRDLVPQGYVELNRDVSYADSASLAKTQEEDLLWRDMENDLVQQLMRRLVTAKPRPPVEAE